MAKEWYVVRAVSGQEKKIKKHIDQEIERRKLSRLCESSIDSNRKSFLKCVMEKKRYVNVLIFLAIY